MDALPPLLHARAALAADDLVARRRLGAETLDALRALAADVTAVLPELSALSRFASKPDAAVLAVGWCPRGAHPTEAPRITLALHRLGLDVTWGFTRPTARREGRDRHLAITLRARRAHGDALVYRLSALRTEGARLHARAGDETVIAEEEWLRAPTGTVVFTIPEAALTPGEVLVRTVADRVARLAALGVALDAFAIPCAAHAPRDVAAVRAAVRSVRWDERAAGVGSAPTALMSWGRCVVYDPTSGWFAPAGVVAYEPASSSRALLLQELGATAHAPPPGMVAPASAGLHTRLERWLLTRGHAAARRDAPHIEIRVAARNLPAPNERPALELLVACALEDPSGDTATALAGLLLGAPWEHDDPLDPAAVAKRVTPRHTAAAARGVARLIERGVLVRGVTGTLEGVGECLAHAALRPVVALAVERALGHAEVWPESSAAREEASRARPWELLSVAVRAATLESVAQRFTRYARAAGLVFALDLVRAFVVGLAVKPFAVLTGAPGTGKTALAHTFARFMTEALPGAETERVAVVPVRPDWLDSRGVLGYLNALRGDGAYEDTAALRVMLRACAHPDEPHFLVLDEMNLARVEHYFAEVLSAMESGAPVPLHGRAEAVVSTDGARRVPASFTLPANLFVVGTINIDDTTHPLSAKVFDRAFVWDFPAAPPTSLLREWLGERRAVASATTDERRAFVEAPRDDDPVRAAVLAMGRDGVGARLDRIFDAMARGQRPFGFRVASEVLRFVHVCEREALDVPPAWKLDHAVLGKVLPRLAGARRELEPLLRALLVVCTRDDLTAYTLPPSGAGLADRRAEDGKTDALPVCARRVREMLAGVERDGFASFSRG